VIKAATSLNIVSIGLVNAVPYVAAGLGLLWCTRSSDRHKERRLHAGIPMIVGGLLLFLGSQVEWGMVKLIVFVLVGSTMYMTLPLISTLVTDLFPSRMAIPASAMIGSVGNLFGGFVGPQLIGSLKQYTGNFTLAFSLIGLFGVGGGLLILSIRKARAADLKAAAV
jgi:MFS family permease